MDLLGSILSSMDKPPAPNEKEKKLAKAVRAKQQKEQEKEQKKREEFKKKTEEQIQDFIDDQDQKKLKFPPTDKVYRSILHEIAEAAGLISFAFGTEGFDRHITVFKKEYPLSEEELLALRMDEEYDPAKHKAPGSDDVAMTTTNQRGESRQPQAPPTTGNYQEKYKHLLRGLECAEHSAVKMEPNKAFGYVPSANKRDLRSIEQTLDDMRSRKKPKLEETTATVPPDKT